MTRKTQEPVEVLHDEGTAHERLVTTHPAFASITAARVSGGAYLYGSDFQHQHYMVVRIAKSELHRNLANDWHHSELRGYIEIAMSEAQWQAFISSPNTSGAQCTLQALMGDFIPGLPAPKSRGKQFQGEAREAAQEAFERIDNLIADIDALTISNSRRAQLKQRAESVRASLESSLPFILEQFGEHMEAAVEKARAEINAHASRAAQITGYQPTFSELPPPPAPRITRSRKS